MLTGVCLSSWVIIPVYVFLCLNSKIFTMSIRPLHLKKDLLKRMLPAFRCMLFMLLAIFAMNPQVMAVGTAQVMPNAANGVGMYIGNTNLSGPYMGAPSQNRIRFYITNNVTENLYFNVRAYDRGTNAQIPIYYRVVNPLGVATLPAPITTGQQIANYTQAVTGPNIAGLVPGGYSPMTFDPALNGEYYIEIYQSSDLGITATTDQQVLVTLFDFTVATATNVKSNGRIYSQAWSLLTYDPATNIGDINHSLESDFYGYTADSTVVKLDLQTGFRPFGFVLYMNKFGAVNGSNWATDRRSQNTGATAPSLPNGYPVFLVPPDPTVFPIAATASAPQFGGKIYGCAPNLYIPYYVDKPGDVAILLDLNGAAGFQAGTSDRYLYFYNVPVGYNVGTWNGLNGQGATVTTAATINMTLSMRRGRVNIPMYDAELNTNGMNISGVSPLATVPKLYFDDALLANTVSTTCSNPNTDGSNNNSGGGITNADVGVASPGRAWDGAGSANAVPAPTGGGGSSTLTLTCDDYGNVRTINTWFWAYEISSAIYTVSMPSCSNDGDAISYATDLDDDNDGVSDIVEGGGTDPFADADTDGIPNFLDTTPGGAVPAFTDTNNDGINDAYDTDLDSIVNSFDLDSDNDGIPDLIEAGGVDTDGNGRVDGTADVNGNGLIDTYDASVAGGHTLANRDTDGDGIPNTRDLDSDGDGIPDIREAGGADINNDGKADITTDTDGDGLVNTYDPDNDNNETNESPLNSLIITGADTTNDGLADSYTRGDFDKDNKPNCYDRDADGDGIPDVEEAGIAHNTGSATATGATGTTGWSITVDGMLSLNLPNSDSDIRPNYLDIDSDNDGITDNVEGQYTNQYVLPTGLDTDGDGIDNAYDIDNNIFYLSQGVIPVNFQGAVDVLADYIDPDTDDDGISDLIEGHDADKNNVADYTLTGLDTDDDGLDNAFDLDNTGPNVKNQGMNGIIPPFGFDNPPADPPAPLGARGPLQRIVNTDLDRAWRTINIGALLPLTLLKFTAEKQAGEYVLLSWESSNETGFKEYVLERSTDGMNYTVVAVVPGKGGLTAQYAYTDNAGLQSGTKRYYRLRQVDVNGRITYSRTLSVSLQPANGITLLVTPNPSNGNVALKVSSNKKRTAVISIMDAQGRIMASKRTGITNGDNIIMLTEASRLANGMYTVQLNTDEERMSVKLVIQK
jgi:hypothetical protein